MGLPSQSSLKSSDNHVTPFSTKIYNVVPQFEISIALKFTTASSNFTWQVQYLVDWNWLPPNILSIDFTNSFKVHDLDFLTNFIFVLACVRACVRAFIRYFINPSIPPRDLRHNFSPGILQFLDVDVYENRVIFMWTYRSVEALIMVLPSKDRCSTPPECPWNDLKHKKIKFHHVVVTVHSCFSQFFQTEKEYNTKVEQIELKNNWTIIKRKILWKFLKRLF